MRICLLSYIYVEYYPSYLSYITYYVAKGNVFELGWWKRRSKYASFNYWFGLMIHKVFILPL